MGAVTGPLKSKQDQAVVAPIGTGTSRRFTVLGNAGVTKPPILDWFYIAMRLQRTKLAAASLSTDDPGRETVTATIVAEVERLNGRIWNSKAKNAQRSINRIR